MTALADISTTPLQNTGSASGEQTLDTCLWCEAPVRLVRSRWGVLMPIDPTAHRCGRLVPVTGRDGVARGRILTQSEGRAHRGPRWRSHYETCTNAVDLRVPRPSGARLALSRYRCPECEEPLALILLVLGQASHPACREATADVGLVAGHIRAEPVDANGARARRPAQNRPHRLRSPGAWT